MTVGAAIALGAAIGLALGVVVSLATDVPLAPEAGLALGALAGWLLRRDRAEGARRVSEANVEIVRRWFEAVGSGDLAEDLWAPDLEIVNAEGWALEATYHGRAGLRRWWSDLAEAFSDLELKVEEITPVDGERVLTEQRLIGHFRTTGIPFDAPWASVVTLRGGQIASVVGYLSKHRALQAIEG